MRRHPGRQSTSHALMFHILVTTRVFVQFEFQRHKVRSQNRKLHSLPFFEDTISVLRARDLDELRVRRIQVVCFWSLLVHCHIILTLLTRLSSLRCYSKKF